MFCPAPAESLFVPWVVLMSPVTTAFCGPLKGLGKGGPPLKGLGEKS